MRSELICRGCFNLRRKSLSVYFLVSCALFTSYFFFTKRSVIQFNLSNPLKSNVRFSDVFKALGDLTRNSSSDVRRCGNVFPDMLQGKWVPKQNVSDKRKRGMDDYLLQTRGEYRIPGTLQRADGKCGNLTYEGVPLFRHMWFRALCDPKGPTPCCYNFRCTNRSVEKCQCRNCLDSRTPVHAELSDWLPARPECRPREFYANETCEMLKGTRVVLAGDSFVRHLFVALVMLLTDDFQDGALRKDANAGARSVCQGMYQINGLKCRDLLDENRTLCGGTTHLTYLEVFQAGRGRFLLPYLQRQASTFPRLLVLVGVGIHDDFRADLIWPVFLQPIVEYFTKSSIPSAKTSTSSTKSAATTSASTPLNGVTAITTHTSPDSKVSVSWKRKWPKLIWVNTHAPGLLKSPLFPAQSFEGVKYYNMKMAAMLQPYGVPVLDTFNMTAPLHSVDGTHYGYGANHLKVQFVLNWVKEKQDRGEW